MMMFYKNMKAVGCSLDSDSGFFSMIAGVLQGDTYHEYQEI